MNKLLIVGTVAFDAIETPFGKTDKIIGGSAPYIGLSASQFNIQSAIVCVTSLDLQLDASSHVANIGADSMTYLCRTGMLNNYCICRAAL